MFDIWYVPDFPVGAINFSDKIFRPDWDYYRPGLVDNIKEQGMVNPLIILNHRSSAYEGYWLKVGNNRMYAIRELGWTHVPCIVTGDCKYEPKIKVEQEDLPKYFRDGFPVIDPLGEGSIRMAGYAAPEHLEYPLIEEGEYLGKVATGNSNVDSTP